ncbi:hypothetical protein EW146_g8514 [Bondarzewia mesenterica]|uniref:Cytochrome b561 domain-containing protein n=1 Tax=Bondarzewia mesenterica TaxID=1095465 RepID=A0A4S4LDQ2_9AGAM|nr:hypothetical protein EW146_g8514 [Bondarzewia mesenterica]
MVIMWPNEDNSVTLSQRTAPRERMPTVDPNPPRWSNLSMTSTYLDGDLSKLAFAIPQTSKRLYMLFVQKRPSSSAVDERIQFHDRYGRGKLNLAKPVKDEEESVEIPEEGLTDMVLQPYQRSIIAHAIFCIVGFLITLPAGALVASIQKWGVALCVLYFLQCIFGAVIHRAVRAKRIGGVFHGTFGLMTIALSMYQVRLGYKYEWPATTGRGIIKPIENLWLMLVIVLPIMYGAGLLLLPRQFAQARSKISAFDADKIAMESLPLQATEDDDD